MPVYDYTYKTWEGKRGGALSRWLAIPKFTYLDFIGKKLFIWAFIMGWMQFLLWVAIIYFKVNMDLLALLRIPRHVLPEIDAAFYKNAIDWQIPLCFYFSFLMGAGMISADLKHNALVLYCSKPISRWEYFFGKFLSLFILLMLLTALQALLLQGLRLAVLPYGDDGAMTFWGEQLKQSWAIILYSTIISAAMTLMILAASSMAKNKRYAATTFVVYLIGASVVAKVLKGLLDKWAMLAFSPYHAAREIGRQLFRLEEYQAALSDWPRFYWAFWLGIGGLCALCAGILFWRLKRASRFTH
jgi:ABC-2 type transport system permease protein